MFLGNYVCVFICYTFFKLFNCVYEFDIYSKILYPLIEDNMGKIIITEADTSSFEQKKKLLKN